MQSIPPPFPVDISLFDGANHSPSIASLQRSMGRTDQTLQDFCIPANNYFPTPRIFADFQQNLETILKFYPGSNGSIAETLADALGLDPEAIVMGNGSTELIFWIDQLLTGNRVATPVPTFGPWIDHPAALGKSVCPWFLKPEESFQLDVDGFVRFVRRERADTVVICNPNNPTGTFVGQDCMIDLLDELSDLKLIVVDESFIDFAQEDSIPSIAEEATCRSNVLVLKSLGKSCGLHGVRAGYAVGHSHLIERLRQSLPEFNINALAEALIHEFANHQADYESARRRTVVDRRNTEQMLRQVADLRVFPSRGNFVYVRIPLFIDGVELHRTLLCEYGCLVRECGNKKGSDSSYFRIAARPREPMESLVTALTASIEQIQLAYC